MSFPTDAPVLGQSTKVTGSLCVFVSGVYRCDCKNLRAFLARHLILFGLDL